MSEHIERYWRDATPIVFIPLVVMECRELGITTDIREVGFVPVYQSLLDLLEVHGPDCKYLTFKARRGGEGKNNE